MRYAIALEQGGSVVRDAISGQAVTPPRLGNELIAAESSPPHGHCVGCMRQLDEGNVAARTVKSEPRAGCGAGARFNTD